jgi:hypothetical protein
VLDGEVHSFVAGCSSANEHDGLEFIERVWPVLLVSVDVRGPFSCWVERLRPSETIQLSHRWQAPTRTVTGDRGTVKTSGWTGVLLCADPSPSNRVSGAANAELQSRCSPNPLRICSEGNSSQRALLYGPSAQAISLQVACAERSVADVTTSQAVVVNVDATKAVVNHISAVDADYGI